MLGLLGAAGQPGLASSLRRQLDVLASTPPAAISGAAVARLDGVPPHLRGPLIAQLHVLCRLRGQAPTLESAEELSSYLGRCGGLLEKLEAEWWEQEDREESHGEPRRSAADAQAKRQRSPQRKLRPEYMYAKARTR